MEHPTRVGKYELEQFLGGGMSHVYRARDTVLGRRVALKLLTIAGASDDEAKARFLLEARTASNISHENIISVFDFGEEHGRPFIVMEYLEGESLRELIRTNRLGNLRQKLKIATQIARAVDHIHSKKIIHRDIKPENIHLDLTGKVKLMDFGIAKSSGVDLTRSGFTLGTPHYMAPEQVLGQPLTPQADVYAFGILLFEMLTGQKPISGLDVAGIFHNILHEPLNLDALTDRNLPNGVVELVARCTLKQPTQRPPGLAVVAMEIDRLITSPHAPPAISRVTIPPPQAHATAEHDPYDANFSAPSDGIPALVKKLPKVFQSQGGLIFLGAFTVLCVFAILALVLRLTNVI